jgi:hypothetical protein|tara:strand:+ start:709 stop:1014 length:306 start_codon:yes stop_codon:yes gene_type:complete
MADEMKGYREFLTRTTDTESDELDEGSGVITNTLASQLLGKIKALESKVLNSKSVEDKIDNLARQNTKLAGLDAIAIAVSGKSKGLLNKGSRLFSLIRAIK